MATNKTKWSGSYKAKGHTRTIGKFATKKEALKELDRVGAVAERKTFKVE